MVRSCFDRQSCGLMSLLQEHHWNDLTSWNCQCWVDRYSRLGPWQSSEGRKYASDSCYGGCKKRYLYQHRWHLAVSHLVSGPLKLRHCELSHQFCPCCSSWQPVGEDCSEACSSRHSSYDDDYRSLYCHQTGAQYAGHSFCDQRREFYDPFLQIP